MIPCLRQWCNGSGYAWKQELTRSLATQGDATNKTNDAKSGTGGRRLGSFDKKKMIHREAMKRKLDQLTSGTYPLPRKSAKHQVANEFRLVDAKGRPDVEKLDRELKSLQKQKYRKKQARK